MPKMGILLITAGILLVGIGVLMTLFPGIPMLGKLPGDFQFSGKHFKIYFPLGSCILLSVLLTLIVRFLRKIL
jgi:hypothetical protein